MNNFEISQEYRDCINNGFVKRHNLSEKAHIEYCKANKPRKMQIATVIMIALIKEVSNSPSFDTNSFRKRCKSIVKNKDELQKELISIGL